MLCVEKIPAENGVVVVVQTTIINPPPTHTRTNIYTMYASVGTGGAWCKADVQKYGGVKLEQECV